MKLLETFLNTSSSLTYGWTLLHSLWQGRILAVALLAALAALRSARSRHAAASVAMLTILGSAGITCIRLLQQGTPVESITKIIAKSTRATPPIFDLAMVSSIDLTAMAPWLTMFLIAEVCTFYIWNLTSRIAVRRLRRAN